MKMKKLTGILMLLLCILFCNAQLVYAADDKPGEFEITSPDSGDTFDAGDNVTLKWSSSSGCDYYVVNVRDLTTNELIVSGEETSSRSYKISYKKLTAGHKYRAAVSSKGDGYALARSGGECVFYIDEAKPEDFEITAPDSGDSFEAGSSVTLKWSKSKNSDYYVVNVRDLTTNELVIDGKETTSRSYEISSKKLEAGHKYRASVTAYSDSYDKGRSGGECTFSIKEKVVEVKKPEDFTISAPTSGSSYEAGSNVTLKWTTSKNSDYYKVNVRDLTTNKLIVEEKQTTGTSYTVNASALTEGHEYRASVTAYSNELTEGRSGGECTFTIKEKVVEVKKPEDFTITAPTSGSSYEAGSNVTLKWTTSKNSDYYKVNVRDLTTNKLIVEEKQTTGTSYTVNASALTEGHEYRASVTAYSNELTEGRSGGECTFSIKKKVVEVVEVKKPEDFNITAPTSGSSYEAGSNVTVRWTTSKNSDYYKVSLRDLTTNKLLADGEQMTGTSCTINANILTAGHEYRVSVTAYSKELSEGRSGGECTFSIKKKEAEVKKPEDFDITAPEWGETFAEGSAVTIRWTTSKNSDYYVVNVRDLDTNKLIVDGKKVTNRYDTIDADWLKAGHEYRVSVTAYSNKLEEGRSGGDCNFIIAEEEASQTTTQAEFAGTPGEFEITNSSTNYEPGNSVTIRWSASENAKHYFVYVRNLNTGDMISAGNEVSELYYRISADDLLEGNNYSASIAAYNDDYTDAYFCEEFLFVIDFEEPEVTATPVPTATPTATPTPVVAEKIFDGTLGEITFTNKYEEKLGSNSPLLSWNSNLTDVQKNAVKYTVIQAYRKNSDGTSVMVYDQQVNSHCTQHRLNLVGGLYGIEVSYYDETYTRVATGQTRIKTPGTIDGFKIDNVTEGKGSKLQGVINTSSPLTKISCSITDNKSKKEEIKVELNLGGNVQIYSLAGSEFDNKVSIGKLKAGTKTVVITAYDSNGEFLFAKTNLTIYEKKAKVTPTPAYKGISSSTMEEINKNIAAFDYRLFVANKELTQDGYYTVDGKLYHAFCYQGGVTFFVDYAQQKIVSDEVILQKLIFTRNVCKTFESKKVLVNGTYEEQNENIIMLNRATESFRDLWNQVTQVAATSEFVKGVGVAIPAIGTSGAGLINGYKNFAMDHINIDTVMFSAEMITANVFVGKLEAVNQMVQSGNIHSYENAFEIVRTVSTSGTILEELRVSVLDILDYSNVDSVWDKLGWWFSKTWDGLLTGLGAQRDDVIQYLKATPETELSKKDVEKLVNEIKAYGFLVNSSGKLIEGVVSGEVDPSDVFTLALQSIFDTKTADKSILLVVEQLDGVLEKDAYNGFGWIKSYFEYMYFDSSDSVFNYPNQIQTYTLLDDIMDNAEPYLTTARAKLAKGESATIDIYREKKGVKAEYTSADPKLVKVDKNGKVTVLRNDGATEVKITVKITQDGKVYKREFVVEIVK